MITTEEIQLIYDTKVKLSPEYFNKYVTLPPCPVKGYNYHWGHYDFGRTWCILDFIEWTKKHNLTSIEHLGYTCDIDPELEFITASKKTILSFPPYDLHTISQHYQNTFDFFV
jgi:hypothetical protein